MSTLQSKQHSITAGSDRNSWPNLGAIDCLSLQVIGAEEGPTGGKILTNTTFIQRLNTKGGSAPKDGCFVSSDAGKQTLVPYPADYVKSKLRESRNGWRSLLVNVYQAMQCDLYPLTDEECRQGFRRRRPAQTRKILYPRRDCPRVRFVKI